MRNISENKNRSQNLTAESIAMQRSVKIDLFLLYINLFREGVLLTSSCYAIVFSNKERPKRLELILLQSFSTLYAKAVFPALSRKVCKFFKKSDNILTYFLPKMGHIYLQRRRVFRLFCRK